MATGVNLRIQSSKVQTTKSQYKAQHLEYLIWHYIGIHSLLSYSNCDPICSGPYSSALLSQLSRLFLLTSQMEKQTHWPGAADHHICNHVPVSGSISKLKKQSHAFLHAFQRQSLQSSTCTHVTSLLCIPPAQSKLGTHPTSYTDLQLAKLQANPIVTLSHYHSIWLWHLPDINPAVPRAVRQRLG